MSCEVPYSLIYYQLHSKLWTANYKYSHKMQTGTYEQHKFYMKYLQQAHYKISGYQISNIEHQWKVQSISQKIHLPLLTSSFIQSSIWLWYKLKARRSSSVIPTGPYSIIECIELHTAVNMKTSVKLLVLMIAWSLSSTATSLSGPLTRNTTLGWAAFELWNKNNQHQ